MRMQERGFIETTGSWKWLGPVVEYRYASEFSLGSPIYRQLCPICKGSGQLAGFVCHPCGGRGSIDETFDITEVYKW